MLVITKKEAEKKSLESLFKSGGTVTMNEKRVFCTGKYNEKIIGGQVVDLPTVSMVWAERRSGSDGAYFRLYCI